MAEQETLGRVAGSVQQVEGGAAALEAGLGALGGGDAALVQGVGGGVPAPPPAPALANTNHELPAHRLHLRLLHARTFRGLRLGLFILVFFCQLCV